MITLLIFLKVKKYCNFISGQTGRRLLLNNKISSANHFLVDVLLKYNILYVFLFFYLYKKITKAIVNNNYLLTIMLLKQTFIEHFPVLIVVISFVGYIPPNLIGL